MLPYMCPRVAGQLLQEFSLHSGRMDDPDPDKSFAFCNLGYPIKSQIVEAVYLTLTVIAVPNTPVLSSFKNHWKTTDNGDYDLHIVSPSTRLQNEN